MADKCRTRGCIRAAVDHGKCQLCREDQLRRAVRPDLNTGEDRRWNRYEEPLLDENDDARDATHDWNDHERDDV